MPSTVVSGSTVIIDTSVILTDCNCIYEFDNSDILIPLKVLEELDNHKSRPNGVGFNARGFIKKMDRFASKGNLADGVVYNENGNIIKIIPANRFLLPEYLDKNNPDFQIISSALNIKREIGGENLFLFTKDFNMRVISNSLGITACDYIKDPSLLERGIYSGHREIFLSKESIDEIYNNGFVRISDEVDDFNPNEFAIARSIENNNITILTRFKNGCLHKIKNLRLKYTKIKARNEEQKFAIELLMDNSVKFVTLSGLSGCGKTFLALAASLEQIFVDGRNEYDRIIVMRSMQPVGADIGYLPGSIDMKTLPWLSSISDNLKNLIDNKLTMQDLIDTDHLEIQPLTYIRGRSVNRTIIIVDEAQNLTQHEIKTIATRIGEGSKIIFMGDIDQIDCKFVDKYSNGLSVAIEKFKKEPIAGHVNMTKGERSMLATIASKVL